MLPKSAKLVYGNGTADIRVAQLDPTRATFFGTRDMVATFARMTFKLGEQWFDVEGVVAAKSTTTAECVCELMFSAMPAVDSARLDKALRGPRSSTAITPAVRRRIVPTPEPKQRHLEPAPASEVRSLFKAALDELVA